jgi:acyl-CoA thioesterase-1
MPRGRSRGRLAVAGRDWRAFVAAVAATGAFVGLGVSLAPAISAAQVADRCDSFAAASDAREAQVVGRSGPRVLVLGDSWSVGLRLAHPDESWPAQLQGERVRVDGFSGSGYAAKASPCAGASFAQRARQAARRDYDLVIVQGGLNDVDRSPAEIRTGVRAVLAAFEGTRVVLIGPASAPSRAVGVPRVEALLADEAQRAGVRFVAASDLALPYLPDRLHLTATGHREFGEFVAAAVD